MNLWKIDIQQKLVPDSTEPELVFQAAYILKCSKYMVEIDRLSLVRFVMAMTFRA